MISFSIIGVDGGTVVFAGRVKFPQGEGSAVIHRKKNDLLYKDAT